VQRPTTPFEALEAARQDAAYQAAHEQAVQVVNGIAAQYVETRSALSTISTAGGENFARPLPSGLSATGVPEPQNSEPAYRNMNVTAITEPSEQQSYGRTVESAKLRGLTHESKLDMFREEQYFHPNGKAGVTATAGSVHNIHPLRDDGGHANNPVAEPLDNLKSVTPAHQKTTSFTRTGHDANEPTASEDQAAEREPSALYGTRESLSQVNDEAEELIKRRSVKSLPPISVKPETHSRLIGQQSANSLEFNGHEMLDSSAQLEPPSFEIPNPSHVEVSSAEGANAVMIPPYSGLGPVRRTNEEREPRPAYLKERKSAWLPDTVAAPADGVITPDWFTLP